MTKRIITGLLLAVGLVGAVGWGPFWVLAPLLGLAILVAHYEFLRLPGDRLKPSDRFAGLLGCVVLLLVASLWHHETVMPMLVMTLSCLTVFFLLLVLFTPHPIEEAGSRATTLVTGLLYIGFLGSTALMVVRPETGQEGRVVLLLIAVVTWLNDSMAFFGGKFLGRHKLYPTVSPKKTWEGSFFGLMGSVAGVFIVKGLFITLWEGPEFQWTVGNGQLVAFALIGGALGQMGDLVESVFKRSYGIKDSGSILPGHGGLLDRIDAFLFVAPFGFFWFYLGDLSFYF